MTRAWKTAAAVLLTLVFVAVLGGCSVFGPKKEPLETLVNGTTAGNIVNKGFAVKDGEDLYIYNTSDGEYKIGDIVRSNIKTRKNSLAMQDGGLYMSVYNGYLYYCRQDGIYRASMASFAPERLVEANVTQLQIVGDRLFFVEDGTIKSTDAEGNDVGFAPIEHADCLTAAKDKLYYIDTAGKQIWQAGIDGKDAKKLFDPVVKQFGVVDTVFFYIDEADGFIKRVTEEKTTPVTVVEAKCSGFNVSGYGMFYTREKDGKTVCCNADINGENEQVIKDTPESARHLICMFNEGAIVLPGDLLGA